MIENGKVSKHLSDLAMSYVTTVLFRIPKSIVPIILIDEVSVIIIWYFDKNTISLTLSDVIDELNYILYKRDGIEYKINSTDVEKLIELIIILMEDYYANKLYLYDGIF